ncbi:hypothetical protein ES705_27467 [subsurface metagenome]
MNEMEKKLKELRSLIVMELDLVEQFEKPNIYMIYNDKSVRDGLINDIIGKIIVEKRTISESITSIEREFNINFQND